jgi:hypothetical protein
VKRDIKAIYESYNQGMNHTTNSGTAYEYAPTEYTTSRDEQEESTEILRKRVALELNNMSKRAQRGLKEDYNYILLNIKNIIQDISSIAGKQ